MRDDFSEEVKRTLAARAGNICSNPDCSALTSGPQDDPTKALNVGVGAHITSAASGGPRYDPSLSTEQRRHPDNGIWLCQTDAKLVDNDTSQFPTDVLRAWKTLAEHKAKNSIGRTALPTSESAAQKKCREILTWKGKDITFSRMHTGRAVYILGPKQSTSQVKVVDCTEFSVEIAGVGWADSIPLANIEIARDVAQNRLELQARYA